MGVESELNIAHFRRLLEQEAQVLTDNCLKWRNIMNSTSDIPEDIEGDVMVAIGQAELLMKERFSQFAGLIDDCEFKRGEKEVTCLDLQGFWDIIYFQVEDVIRRFVNLEKVKSNGWKEDKLPPQTLTPKAGILLYTNCPLKGRQNC
ncbi:disks large-associated protein 5 [Cherax quadricarinatus]|uniref:disks large-associated protein 5 n=1 Tax=Cherax quadricarinatus TaxID=27406 RepID=UPI00387EE3A6